MVWSFKSFDKLKVQELYDLLKLRSDVFVVEQNCVYSDQDDKDQEAIHVLGYKRNRLLAYARILPIGSVENKYAMIGRIVIRQTIRGTGVGKELVSKSIDYCQHTFNELNIKISAQSHLKNFYQQQGFTKKGDDYLEDGIPHCAMILSANG